jgi:hypothetical protein
MSVSETSSFEDIFRSLLHNPYVLAMVEKMLPTILTTMSSFEEIILELLRDPRVFVNLEDSSIHTIMVALGREWDCEIGGYRNKKEH